MDLEIDIFVGEMAAVLKYNREDRMLGLLLSDIVESHGAWQNSINKPFLHISCKTWEWETIYI